MPERTNLPSRLYYTLSQAAKELGCDVDYLLHLGAVGDVELMMPCPLRLWVRGISWSAVENIPTTEWALMCSNHTFITLHPTALAEIEIRQQCKFINFRRFWDHHDEFNAEEKFCLPKKDDAPQKTSWYECFMGTEEEEFNADIEWPKDSPDHSRPAIAHAENLFLPSSELELLRSGGRRERLQNVDPSPFNQRAISVPSTKGKNSYLRTIDALARALTRSDLTQTKPAEAVLAAIAKAGVAEPVGAKTLAGYLAEARGLREQ